MKALHVAAAAALVLAVLEVPQLGGRGQRADRGGEDVDDHAREQGPQRVSVRGHDAVVVMSVEEFESLMPEKPRQPFLQFMEGLHLEGLDLEREVDHGREAEL